MPMTSKEMIKHLKRNGFIEISQNGSHMEKMFYPAIFHKAEDNGFWISFPDFPECLTEGDNMTKAYEMAIDALGLAISDRIALKEDLPVPSMIDQVDFEDGFLVVIEFDLIKYRKKHNTKSIKKTLTIPEWLNEEALARNINFSQVLQEALMLKLNLN